MISKEDFVKILESLDKYRQDEVKMADAMSQCSDGFRVDFYPGGKYQDLIITLLGIMFYEKDIIEYFVYECDFGREADKYFITEGDREIHFYTAGDLYDYLVEDCDGNK